MYKKLCIILAAMFCLCLSACQKAENTENPADDLVWRVTSEVTVDALREYDFLTRCSLCGNRIYTAGISQEEEDGEIISTVLSFDALTGEDVQTFPYQPAAEITAVCPLEDGSIWVVQQEYPIADGKPDFQVSPAWILAQLSPQGEPLNRVELDFADDGTFYAWFLKQNPSSGTLYLGGSDKVYVFSADGKSLFSMDAPLVQDAAVTPDGGMYILYFENGEIPAVAAVNENGKALEKPVLLSREVSRLLDGNGGQYALYAMDYTTMQGYDTKTGKQEPIFDFSAAGITTSTLSGIFHLNGSFTCISNPNLLTRIEKTTPPEKKILTLGCISRSSTLEDAVVEFNRTNPEYRIEFRDYYEDSLSWYECVERYKTDMIAGNMPDIVNLEQLPVGEMSDKGFLRDLYPYLDADPELSREDFFENVLDAQTVDGKLLSLVPNFYVHVLYSTKSILGDTVSPSLEQLWKMVNEHPDIPLWNGAHSDSLLSKLLEGALSDFVDEAAGTCSFNTPEFEHLLQIAAAATENRFSDVDWIPLQEGKAFFCPVTMADIHEYATGRGILGDECVITGFPTKTGSQPILELGDEFFGISSTSQYPDAAWEFIRQQLFREEYTIFCISTQKAVFEENLARDTTDKNGNPNDGILTTALFGSSDGTELEFPIPYPTKEQCDEYRELIASAKGSIAYSDAISDIIQEEAGAYFAGQKSVSEVCNLIQNRVEIYLAERN